jgi:hypothetical protein
MKSFPLQREIKSSSNPDEFVQRMALDAMPGARTLRYTKGWRDITVVLDSGRSKVQITS